jgi:hypothetical protein
VSGGWVVGGWWVGGGWVGSENTVNSAQLELEVGLSLAKKTYDNVAQILVLSHEYFSEKSCSLFSNFQTIFYEPYLQKNCISGNLITSKLYSIIVSLKKLIIMYMKYFQRSNPALLYVLSHHVQLHQ